MSVIALFVLLGVLITVHELGHFLVAKLAGVRVLTFSLGFGPKILRIQRGETEYCLSALPLGGYVRMYGDDVNEEIPADQRRFAFLERPFLVKSAIALAGPVANLLLPLALFFALGIGEKQAVEARVGTVLADEPAARAGVRAGDRIVSVDGAAVADFDDLVDEIGRRAGQPTQLTLERTDGPTTTTLVVSLTPTPAKSPDPTATAPVGRIGLLPTRALPLVVVAQGSPAAAAGLQRGDRIVSVDGVAVTDAAALEAALAGADPGAPLTLVVTRTADGDAAGSGGATKVQRTVVVAGPSSSAPAPVPGTPPSDPGTGVDVRTDQPANASSLPEPTLDVASLRFAVLDGEAATPELLARIEATRARVVEALRRQRMARGIAPLEGLVTAVEPDSPAGVRGVKANQHRVVAVDGRPLRIAGDLPTALQVDVDAIHVVGLVDDAGQGATLAFRLQKSSRRELGGARILGVGLASAQGDAALFTRHVGVVDGMRGALANLWTSARVVLSGYWMLLTGKVGLEQIGGPVLIANLAGEAARAGAETFVATMCLVSVNLAFLNLLPVPVLDGGHLLLFTLEAIRRRRLSLEARIRATKIGMLFVGALMLIALINDVRSLLP
jgi:regulator of sigma E protease